MGVWHNTFCRNGAGCFTIMVANRSAVDKLAGAPVGAELAIVRHYGAPRRSSGRANLLVREDEAKGAMSPERSAQLSLVYVQHCDAQWLTS